MTTADNTPPTARQRGISIIVRRDDGTAWDASDDPDTWAEIVEALRSVEPGPGSRAAQAELDRRSAAASQHEEQGRGSGEGCAHDGEREPERG